MPRTRTGTHTLCASLRSRNKLVSFTRAIYTEMYRENAAPKNRDTHFVRACAVEMHLKISQEPLQKIPRPSWSTLTGTRTFCRAFEVEMHRKISQEPRYTEISRENAAPQNRDTHTHTLCEPALSKCAWRFHKSHFIQKCTGKYPNPAGAPDQALAFTLSVDTVFREKKAIPTPYHTPVVGDRDSEP